MTVTFSSATLSPAGLFLRPSHYHPKFSTSIRCCSSLPQSMDDRQQPQATKRVVVCGGGVIGVYTAYFLAKKGAAVTLVEISSVGCAASGKAGGFLALDWCDGGPVESLAWASFNLHRLLSEGLNGPESTLLNTAVKKYGAEVVIGKVDEVRVEEGRVESVVLEGERVIELESVVLALGPWTGKFDMLASMFRVYGEVYICGMSSEEGVPDDPEQIGNPVSIVMLKRVAKNVSSHLTEGEARVKAEQACFFLCTDSLPVIGELPGVKGCYVATGHSCRGILNGPATGAAVAALVVDGRATIVDLTRLSC
ncbi:hypothetical protein F3Y22_tig00110745pilonHSYRG00004 [Hibiscus syriacus]|uniref:FAD dependent oxidoreductase domain-containing protein n=1 Tax=Hibiscus syriacus TaxID=106335 RepID=A0A6A2ZV40_HIBSY|nr:hypothetical protein F3Y22_tig00110745pilonHSYRG00004 [Hibiscus syriacus]